MQPDEFADMVVLAVKAALAPVQAELAALREKVAIVDVHGGALSTLRDRVVTVETKAVQPVPPDTAFYELRDELRDRLLVLETKMAVPAIEAPVTPTAADTDDLRDRIVTLETRAAGPSLADMAIVDLRERLTSLERRVTDDATTKEIGAIRERIAVMEVRAQMPGPPGQDGANGKDGADGLGFEDLAVALDDERTMAVKFARGDQSKVFHVKLLHPIWRGVWTEGKSYDVADRVTWGGSEWHCNEATTSKPGESKAWTLCVKKGRDGKDGRDGRDLVPVVKVAS